MHCWLCEADLIWGGDHDLEDNEDYHVVTNLSCPNCDSLVYVYHPKPKEEGK
tara:strand:- start:590 stop:745 length:156 start_codon:yes stop_codon:yes gene_type:complete